MQVRIHRALATDLYLRVRSKPIIEHSSQMRFAPYALRDARVEELLAAHRLGAQEEQATRMYNQVRAWPVADMLTLGVPILWSSGHLTRVYGRVRGCLLADVLKLITLGPAA